MNIRTHTFTFITASLALLFAGAATALDVKLTETRDFVTVNHDGRSVRIERIQDENNVLTGGFAKTSRKCPPFCIHAMHVAPGVTTVGEVEIFDFMERQLRNGSGVLIDARTPAWNKRGTIPGSINLPFTVFSRDTSDPELASAMAQLGVTRKGPDSGLSMNSLLDMIGLGSGGNSVWDFTNAKEALFWCNGPWCDQSPRAINALLKQGYPAEKLFYYRGGMQLWQILGLTTIVPE